MACSSGDTASCSVRRAAAFRHAASTAARPTERPQAPPRNAPAHGSCGRPRWRGAGAPGPARRAGAGCRGPPPARRRPIGWPPLSCRRRAGRAPPPWPRVRSAGSSRPMPPRCRPPRPRRRGARRPASTSARRRARPAPGRASGARSRRHPRSDQPARAAVCAPRAAGVFGRDAGGGVGLGDGAVPLLGAAQQAGEQAALVHARGVGGDQCLQRGDRRRVAGLAHPGRHQQATRVAPAVRRQAPAPAPPWPAWDRSPPGCAGSHHAAAWRRPVPWRRARRVVRSSRQPWRNPSARPSPRAARTSARSPAPAPAAAGWRCADCWAGRWTPAAR